MWLEMSFFPSNGYMPSSSPNEDQPFLLLPLAPPLSKPNALPKPFTLSSVSNRAQFRHFYLTKNLHIHCKNGRCSLPQPMPTSSE